MSRVETTEIPGNIEEQPLEPSCTSEQERTLVSKLLEKLLNWGLGSSAILLLVT